VAARPHALSGCTEIKRLIRDPYAIYRQNTAFKLRALNRWCKSPDAPSVHHCTKSWKFHQIGDSRPALLTEIAC